MPRTCPPRDAAADLFAGIDLQRVGDCLRAIGHPDRLRLIAVLARDEMPVNVLAERVALAQPVVSGHLRILQARGLLASRRDGQRMLYRIANPALGDICTCIRNHFGDC
jgi:DNA-binding transcriptional ArsR family regulator